MALHYPLLDGIVVAAVVHEVPRLVGNVARGLRRGLAAQHVHELQLERLQLLGRVARRHPRQRLGGGLAPHRGGHHEAVAQHHLVHERWTPYSPGVARLHLLRVFCDEHGGGGNPLGVFLDGAEVPADAARPWPPSSG